MWEALRKIEDYLKNNLKPNVYYLKKLGNILEKTVVLYKGDFFEEGFELLPGDVTKGEFRIKIGGKFVKGASVIYAGAIFMDEFISIGRGTVIESGAFLKGPTIIGDNTEIRQGAYIRGKVLIGDKCIVGHTTEMKNAIMLGESKAGHFAYIGDSILGKVNLGAGTKLANLKILESTVVLNIEGNQYNTGLRKFGAVLGDGVETGCNTVTTPGTLVGKGTLIYPNTTLRGYYSPNVIVKSKISQEIVEKKKL